MMGSLSIWHWLILAGVVAVLFGGGGKLSSLMGDAAKGIRAFRDGLKGEEEAKPGAQPTSPQAGPTGTLPVDSLARNEQDARVPRAEL